MQGHHMAPPHHHHQQHQQHAMYYHHHQQQQQHYGQYDQYAGYRPPGYHPGQQQQQPPQHIYQQQPAQQPGVLPGGPSPGGWSHNTPSPQAHSEDGDSGDHVKNNNLKPEYTHANPGGLHSLSTAPRKPKISKRKKKRDPNEPQKPVSAYALFFRDSQGAIKLANPNAAFGDVSKIVASMWDNLDPENKGIYKKRTENAKKEYLKKLAAYRASLVSKGGLDGNPYAPYASTYSPYADHLDLKSSEYHTGPSAGYGQPVPPRPPVQSLPPGYNQMQQQQQQHSQVLCRFQLNV